MTLFELPMPVELGGGWSLRYLTAAQMLACRGEGEAHAEEERDKALWANAVLLSQVLLRDGEPAFESGRAVLEGLTVGQMDHLARRWWEQDDFSGQPSRTEWTDREGSKNEHFDMARFLALGGEAESPYRDLAEEGEALPRRSGPSLFPEVWPRRLLAPEVPAEVQRTYMEPYMAQGATPPHSGGAVPAEGLMFPSGQPTPTEEPSRPEHSVIRVLLPEEVQATPGLTVEELDRAVERDARRYDGGFSLY